MALWSCDNFTVHQVSGFYSARLWSVKPVEFIPVSPISHSVIYFFFFFFLKILLYSPSRGCGRGFCFYYRALKMPKEPILFSLLY